MVREAVQYEDARFDINTVSDPLTGMDYDKAHYNLSVLDDGGFNGSRINEYHITYRLINTDNGKMVADLERYVWITVPGVDFDAPELKLYINQSGYNLQDGITYDSSKYVLTTITPDRVDISAAGRQRVMFCLTAGEGSSIPDAAPLEATPSQAKSSVSEGDFTSQISSKPWAEPVPGEPETATESSASESETMPIAAIFGRNVSVETGPVVVIDAPPLVIMAGTVTSHDLLEGVTARDEDGNPVVPQVVNRSELDLAAEKAAPGQKEPDPFPAARSFFTLESIGGKENASESDALPANIPAGQYKVTISAVHPVTGEVFTMERSVEVRMAAVRLDYPADSGKTSEEFGSLGSAIAAVKADNPRSGLKDVYTLSLLQDYSLTPADVTEFGKASGLPADATVILTGPTSNPTKPYTLSLVTDFILPRGSAGVTGAAFEFRNISLTGTRKIIAANGSKLTMGKGLSIGFLDRISVVGGIYESGNAAKDLTLNGNTWLDIRSGSYDKIIGGNWHYWDEGTDRNSPATSIINGNTTVQIDGGNDVLIAYAVYGGSYLAGGNTSWTAAQRNGNSSVTKSGHNTVVSKLYAGSGADYPAMLTKDFTSAGFTSNVLFEGGTVSQAFATSVPNDAGHFLPGQGDVGLTVSGSQSITDVYDFGAVHLKSGSSLTVSGKLGRTAPFAENARPSMLLDFQGNAKLTLKSTVNTAGSFRIQGEGNTLVLPRTGSGPPPPLTLDGSVPNVRVNNARLALCYPSGTAARSGDKLLSFNPTKRNAQAADYDVPDIKDLAILSNKTTGCVYLGNTVTVQEQGGSPQPYVNLEKAMIAIGNRSGSYTVTIRQEGYELTTADGIALATQGSKAQNLTFTSQFITTAEDPLEPGESVGKEVTRTIIVGAGRTADDPKSDLFLNGPVNVIKGMKLKYLQEGCSLYANGHTLTVGPSVEILSDAGYYPVLYGGARDRAVASANMTLLSGRYGAVYGGGQGAGAPVTGNASTTFGGDAELHGPMYGGGRDAEVGSTAVLNIIGGRALAADTESGAKNVIVGGGQTGAVGNARINISGGIANGTIEIAGCDGGNVRGDVEISIREPDKGPAPKAPLGNLYGASLRKDTPAGTVGGNINITITNGKDYGTIRGGRAGLSGTGHTSTITFKSSSVKVTDIMDFDVLNLGDAASSADKATLFLTGKLQGSSGGLNFWGGSVLTLQGTSMDPADLVVKNLHTDATANRSHLHMYKGPETGPGADPAAAISRPLHITGENTSEKGNKLVLGEYGPGGLQERDMLGDRGDRLLKFDSASKADTLDYVSDIQGLDIVLDEKDPGVVELGSAKSPKISLEKVLHAPAPGAPPQADRPGTPVLKTLFFKIDSFRDDAPTEPGSVIQSAYVSTNWQPDSAWKESGVIPEGGQAITVTQDPLNPVRWSGTVTMAITPPVEPSPVYYYAHVRDENNRVNTIMLDVHSPLQVKSPEISKDGDGNYTFKVELQDPKPVKPEGVGPDITYNTSGLRQLAWAAGSVKDPDPAGQDEALAAVMAESAQLKKVLTLDTPTTDSYIWTFTVTPGLGPLPSDMVVYLYAKDSMGNTGIYPFPLNENLIDVQVPMSAGTMALRGGNTPSLLAPNLYLVNWSNKPVKAELVGADIPSGQGTGNDKKLLLTNRRSGPWAANELNLMVKPVTDGLGKIFFPTTSVKDINPLTGAVDLGIMPARTQENHGASFTFDALYDPDNIIQTSGWSQCVLSYRFSLAAPAPDSGSPGPVLKAEMKGGDAGG